MMKINVAPVSAIASCVAIVIALNALCVGSGQGRDAMIDCECKVHIKAAIQSYNGSIIIVISDDNINYLGWVQRKRDSIN